LAVPAALASESEVCANDGTCAQDEATLLQMQGLRAKLDINKHKQAPANQIQGCPTSSNFDDNFATGNVRCCSMDGAVGNSGNFPRTFTFSDGSSKTGRECNAGDCNGDADATCHDDVSFAQAVELCSSNGERLCTQEEIGVTCGTGCTHNHHYVWFSDDPPNMAQGCPGSSQAYDETSGAVRCCSVDGTDGNSGNFPRTFTFADGSSTTGRDCGAGECNNDASATCHDDVTFAQAEEMCRSNGERLCTRDEVSVTCGTGCRHNHHLVWVSGFVQPPRAATSDGCLTSNYVDGEYPTTIVDVDATNTAAVRCCSADGSSCTTQGLGDSTTGDVFDLDGGVVAQQACITSATFSEAAGICAAEGLRLCTSSELDSGVCCGTGCWHDHRAIWTSN